jgi:hypothetical protein
VKYVLFSTHIGRQSPLLQSTAPKNPAPQLVPARLVLCARGNEQHKIKQNKTWILRDMSSPFGRLRPANRCS